MNQELIKGKWLEIKGEIRKSWGNLTGDEIEQTKGNIESITGLLVQKYGMAKEEALDKLSMIVDKFEKTVSKTSDSIKQNLK